MPNKKGSDYALIKKKYEAVIKKAEKGDIYSMKLMAQAYTESEYLPKDCFAAEAWLRKAAELGSDEAKKQLAKLLAESNGIAKDLEEAFDINHELMLDCDLDAMAEVGKAYKLGLGIAKDEQKGSLFIKHAFNIALDLQDDEE